MLEDWSLFWDMLPTAALKLGVALLCGFLLGIERERKDKPAGLRTIILITVGAALFMIVSLMIAFATEGPESITRVDPSRIAAQVVTGIGFLGGGAIIQARGSVHGLTTAAVIWVAAGIGLCIGVGFPLIGLGITLVVLLVLVLLNPISQWLSHQGEEDVLELYLSNDSLILRQVRHVLRQYGVRESNVQIISPDGEERLSVRVTYSTNAAASQRLVEALARIDGVSGRPVSSENA